MLITADKLTNFIQAIIVKLGSTPEEAERVVEHLVKANLRGHDSHGVGMIPTYVAAAKAGELKPNQEAKLVTDHGTIMQFNGQRGYGQRVAYEAMEQAIERCQQTGLVMMTLSDSHHIGRIGTYGEMAVNAGLGSVHFVNVMEREPMVAPHLGAEARFGTNPVCIALPATNENPPFLLDFATSIVALGKTRVAYEKNEQFDDEVLLDNKGQPTKDPSVMWNQPQGALRPLGLHKGYGLMLAAELLAGVMSGGGTMQPERRRHNGIINNMTTFLFDPAKLSETQFLKSETDAMLSYVKNCPSANADEPVLIPGDPERATLKDRVANGIPLSAGAWELLQQAGRDVGLSEAEIDGFAG